MLTTPAKREQGGPVSVFGLGPFRLFDSEFGNLLGRFDADWQPGGEMSSFVPSLDVAETEDAIEVHADLPGMKPEDIDVEVVGDVLRVKGHREETRESKEKEYHRVERRSGSFSRSIMLPGEVDASDVKADYTDGVLSIRLPKKVAVKTQKIQVHGNGKKSKGD